jgi:hypothetical protein
MQIFVSKKLCWFMIFILIFMWSGIIEHKAFADEASVSRFEDSKQIKEKLEKIFSAIEEVLAEAPRRSFDLKAVIQEIGSDPNKIFEWVRDNTYLVPYRGSLRGPTGVLMDRLGNSLDRALLLYELLQLSGHKVRIVRGSLSQKQIKELMPQAKGIHQEDTSMTEQYLSESIDAFLQKYSKKYQFDQNEIREYIDQMTENQAHIAANTQKKVMEHTKEIGSLIRKYRDRNSIEADTSEKAFQDHWWVQIEKENNWLDLDVNLVESTPGEVLTEAEEMYKPDEIDQDLFHSVMVRIVIEKLEEGDLEETTVIEYEHVPSQKFGEQIILRHYPMNWPEDLNLYEKKVSQQVVKETVLEQKEWLPVLNIGPDQISASSFKDTGEVNETPGKKSASRTGGITGGLFRAMGGGQEEKSDQKSHLSAEWIEYEVRVPGYPTHKVRRQIFDLLGPAIRAQKKIQIAKLDEIQKLRRGLALLGEIEILPVVCQLSSDFVVALCLEKTQENRESLLELVQQGKSIDPEDIMNHLDKITPFFSQLYFLAIARHALSRFSDMIYLDSPNVFSYHKIFCPEQSGGILLRHGFDIVVNNIAVRKDPSVEPFKVRLEQGILDTHAEILLMADSRNIENTAHLFEKTKQQRQDWTVIRDISDSSWEDINLPSDILPQIEQDLADGYLVLVPNKTLPFKGKALAGWWRIDPITGETLGRMGTGEGQSMTEKLVSLSFSIAVGALFWYCSDQNLRHGICDPCKIAGAGVVGFIFGFILTMMNSWTLFAFAMMGWGLAGVVTRIGACIRDLFRTAGDYLGYAG